MGDAAISLWEVTRPDVDVAKVRERLRPVLAGEVDLAARLALDPAARTTDPAAGPVLPQRSETATLLEVRAHDRRGLVWTVCDAIAGLGHSIRSAHLSTYGAEARDVFYVVDADEASAGRRRPSPARSPSTGALTLRAVRLAQSTTQRQTSQLEDPQQPMFDTLQDRLQSAFKNLRGKGRLSEADIDATAREIRVALLDADVAVPVVRDFIDRVKERALGAEVSGALNPAQQVIKIVNDELVGILGGETRRIQFAKNPPTVIMLAGLQGSGKTTLAGKLGRWLQASRARARCWWPPTSSGPTPSTSCRSWGSRPASPSSRPSPAMRRARKAEPGQGRPRRDQRGPPHAARRRHRRHRRPAGIDAELMKQAADIRDAVDPGRGAVRHRRDDRPGRGPDGRGLRSKASTSPASSSPSSTATPAVARRCRCARSPAGRSCSRPPARSSTDFDAFHPDRMASRILDMGDMLTLIEQAEKVFDAEQAAKDAEKLVEGSFTLQDFLKQMEAMAKMGSMTKLMGMLPGMGQFKEQLANFDEREVDRIKAIILSMTPSERTTRRSSTARAGPASPGARVRRCRDVNQLVDRFFEARKMMQQMAKGGGMPGMPGMGGMPGCPARASAPVPARSRSRRRRASASRATRPSGPPRRRRRRTRIQWRRGRRLRSASTRTPTRSSSSPRSCAI